MEIPRAWTSGGLPEIKGRLAGDRGAASWRPPPGLARPLTLEAGPAAHRLFILAAPRTHCACGNTCQDVNREMASPQEDRQSHSSVETAESGRPPPTTGERAHPGSRGQVLA